MNGQYISQAVHPISLTLQKILVLKMWSGTLNQLNKIAIESFVKIKLFVEIKLFKEIKLLVDIQLFLYHQSVLSINKVANVICDLERATKKC